MFSPRTVRAFEARRLVGPYSGEGQHVGEVHALECTLSWVSAVVIDYELALRGPDSQLLAGQ